MIAFNTFLAATFWEATIIIPFLECRLSVSVQCAIVVVFPVPSIGQPLVKIDTWRSLNCTDSTFHHIFNCDSLGRIEIFRYLNLDIWELYQGMMVTQKGHKI